VVNQLSASNHPNCHHLTIPTLSFPSATSNMPPKNKKKAKAARAPVNQEPIQPAPPKAAALPVPPNGWARELRAAEKALTKNAANPSEEDFLRFARACRALRDYKQLKSFIRSTESRADLILSSEGRKELIECGLEATKYLSIRTEPSDPKVMQQLFDGTLPLDQISLFHCNFDNLNGIHKAAMDGDIQMLETMVSYGCAIDFPVHKESAREESKEGNRFY
jgi:hypothetical protein